MRHDFDPTLEAISTAKFQSEEIALQQLLRNPPYDAVIGRKIVSSATALVIAARQGATPPNPLLDTFLSEYGLSSAEGVALMCLAESLLRIPEQCNSRPAHRRQSKPR